MAEREGTSWGAEGSASNNGIFHDSLLYASRTARRQFHLWQRLWSVKPKDFSQTASPSGNGVVSFSSFSDIIQRASGTGQPPSPGEKRSGKPTLTPPSPPRICKRGKAEEQGAHGDKDIADLDYERPWDQPDGLHADIHDVCI
ncbi:hypothetical protein CYMTET_24331 [Cymbomonas tetramitiformis]|uniref:Uncharacterized protein n=1 Tax=Cymbomonas tetramitiformis TaxID=36881 RepID=A0AAE0FVZ8_9CHLO|nr:hypothetical protein CYMTET_24331 [Cymbomonas tetramitiformis]